MRLYLSSFRMGDHPEHLTALVGGDQRRVVVIANALDDAPADVRRAGVEQELAALAALGLEAVELDLRDYFGQEQLWVPKTYATRRYSRITPPARSRRWTRN